MLLSHHITNSVSLCSSDQGHSTGTIPKKGKAHNTRGVSPSTEKPKISHKSNPSHQTPPATPPTKRRTPLQPRTNPRARQSPSPSTRSQSQPNSTMDISDTLPNKPRKTWEKPGPHQRSKSVPNDLARLAQPKNPLPPVKVRIYIYMYMKLEKCLLVVSLGLKL